MEIPQISERQLKAMRQVCFDASASVFTEYGVHASDTLEQTAEIEKTHSDLLYLVSLGIIANITQQHPEQVEAAQRDSGREWRVYEITKVGRAMFQPTGKTTIH